ncbi:MAG: hypothetical protein EXS60_00750 [Candidatus Pacebacteria bacterium]|nr:hypothetical protein [Candidatus Paceibacterota bacterium]
MHFSDPLEKAVTMAKENAARRGLHILHPQHLIEAILQQGNMSGKLQKLGIVPEDLLRALQVEIGYPTNTIPMTSRTQVEEGSEYAVFIIAAEEKAEDNGYTRLTTCCTFASITQLESCESVQRVFRMFDLTEKKLDAMITHAIERQRELALTHA